MPELVSFLCIDCHEYTHIRADWIRVFCRDAKSSGAMCIACSRCGIKLYTISSKHMPELILKGVNIVELGFHPEASQGGPPLNDGDAILLRLRLECFEEDWLESLNNWSTFEALGKPDLQ